MTKLRDLLEKMKQIEQELVREVQKKEEEMHYKILGKKVCFEEEVKKQHKILATNIYIYISNAKLSNILTVPIIWFCFFPAVFLDLVITIYHSICFPVYGIPKVKRSDYIVIDHQALRYLNAIEKINCIFCGYFNGLIAYVQEIAARTEQYWCPIKHGKRIVTIHSRYKKFLEYGDAVEYREKFEEIRKDFSDLK